MPTNEERKQVAARLREAKIENLGFYGFSAHLGESIGKCVRLVSGHYFLVEDGLNRLADLIEPEPERTCRNVGYYSDSTRFECSECEFNGWVKWAKDGIDRVPGYCPNCGAKAVEQ